MFHWDEIACAVDLSPLSHVAMEYAADLAKRLAARLTLVYVDPSVESIPSPNRDEMLELWRKEAEERVGATVRSKRLFGEPVASILQHVREHTCQLLVVGTRGRTGIPRLALGSVAEGIVRLSACPVLIVRDGSLVQRADEEEEIAQYRGT